MKYKTEGVVYEFNEVIQEIKQFLLDLDINCFYEGYRTRLRCLLRKLLKVEGTLLATNYINAQSTKLILDAIKREALRGRGYNG